MLKYEDYKNSLEIHHRNLTEIAKKHNSFEGNVYTFNGVDTIDFMHIKMKNLFNIAQLCSNSVLEIGFCAGNSALLFLVANPNIKFYAVDLMAHKNTVRESVDYLNMHFGNRITLIEGDSLDIIPSLDRKLGKEISLYHIDGWHALEGIQADLKNCYELAKHGAFVIADDSNNECIKNEYDKYVMKNKIYNRPDLVLEKPPAWPHEIGQFIKL